MNKSIIQVKLIWLIFALISQTSVIFATSSKSQYEVSSGIETREKLYEKHILRGEWFFNLHLNKWSLQQFEKAHQIKPGAYFPQYRINQINARLLQPKNSYFKEIIFDFNKPGILISILIFVILFSLISMLIALVLVLLNRKRKSKLEKKIQYLKEEYQTLLVDYLFNKDENETLFLKIKQISGERLSRKVLIDQMIDLSITLTGEKKEKLKDLYLSLNLDKDSYQKAMSRKWHIKAKGFRELAFMNIPIANEEITRCLSSRNNILRMEAQFAMIRLNPENSFGFLDEFEKKFTLWEQLNVYETITFHNLALPDFEHLLYSKNNSIVLFALRMIKVFHLTKAFSSMIKLLSHKAADVRNMTIHVLGSLKFKESLPYLKKIYKHETYENCIAIIQAMANINDEKMLNFLKLVLDKEDDVQLQIEAAIAINKIGVKGSEALNKLLDSDYKNYQIIVKHVLDKRIN